MAQRQALPRSEHMSLNGNKHCVFRFLKTIILDCNAFDLKNLIKLYARLCNIQTRQARLPSKACRNGAKKCLPTRMGFEPTRAMPNGLAVHRLNHSATSSHGESYALLSIFNPDTQI